MPDNASKALVEVLNSPSYGRSSTTKFTHFTSSVEKIFVT
ncbi:hypothetical protein ACU8KH_05888 [Lachancea thermotolerans]